MNKETYEVLKRIISDIKDGLAIEDIECWIKARATDYEEKEKIKERLEYLRKQIKDENISYGEIAELQGLEKYIEKGDIELLQWVKEEEKECKHEHTRWLDCADCKEKGVPCPEIVCIKCGASCDEIR